MLKTIGMDETEAVKNDNPAMHSHLVQYVAVYLKQKGGAW